MFTWICPECGREVPPAYSECPDCAARRARQESGEAEVEAAPPAAEEKPPKPAPPPAPPPPAVAAKAPPRQGGGIPTWLMSILFAIAFIGLGAGVYWGINQARGRGATQPSALALEDPGAAAKGKPHPLQRHIEVTGVRFLQDAKRRTEVRFVLVNHSPETISDLGGTVTIWGRTQKSDEEAVGSFAFKVPSIGGWESREMSAVVNTTLRSYELPDWQNVTAEVQVTSP
jgi:hypothetical protein